MASIGKEGGMGRRPWEQHSIVLLCAPQEYVQTGIITKLHRQQGVINTKEYRNSGIPVAQYVAVCLVLNSFCL